MFPVYHCVPGPELDAGGLPAEAMVCAKECLLYGRKGAAAASA